MSPVVVISFKRFSSFLILFVIFRADTVDKLKMKLPLLETQLGDNSNFKDFYNFTFNYAKNPCQKGLDLDVAIAYWNIVMRGRFKFLHLWCKFLEVYQCFLFSPHSFIHCFLIYVLFLLGTS